MQIRRIHIQLCSGLGFFILLWGGYELRIRPSVIRWIDDGRFFPFEISLVFLWGILLSLFLHTFWMSTFLKQDRAVLGRTLLRLHVLYILPCVVAEYFSVILVNNLGLREPLAIWSIIIGVGAIFAGLALYDLLRGPLSSLLKDVKLFPRCSLLLPTSLGGWFLSILMVIIFFFV